MSINPKVPAPRWLRAVALGAAVVAVVLVAVVAVPGVAHAATPPFEPDPLSIGGLTFFNASGTAITSGSTTTDPFATYVEASTVGRAGDTKATLYVYTPVNGVPTGAWSGSQLGLSTAYPNAGAPAPLTTATLPVYSASTSDTTLAQYQTETPNTDTSSDGYAGLYQVRLFTSGPQQQAGANYSSADIVITGTTWTVVYTNTGSGSTTTTTTTPGSSTTATTTGATTSTSTGATTTTTTGATTSTTATSTGPTSSTAVATTVGLAISPTDPVAVGTTVTLTATLTPSDASGTVQFLDGSAALGGPAAVTSGTASTTTSTLEVGPDSLSAQFTPDDPTAFAASISPSVPYTVDAETATATTATSTSSGSAPGGLALTGANEGRAAGAGVALVLVGSLLVLAELSRRRHYQSRPAGPAGAGGPAGPRDPANPGGHRRDPAGPGGHQQGPAGPGGHQQGPMPSSPNEEPPCLS